MKEKILFTLACTLLLTNCSNHSDDTPGINPEMLYPLQFNIQLEKEIVPFPATRSMPDYTLPEPTPSKTETPDTNPDDLYNQIEYLVYTVEGDKQVLYKHKQFTSEDMDFGIVYDSLPQGNYQFYFVAHNSEMVTCTGSVLTFGKVSDTFYQATPLTISAAQQINEDVTLNRIVSRIEFVATDTIPKGLCSFVVRAAQVANQLDLKQGAGITAADSSNFSYTFLPAEIGQPGKTHAFYTFLPVPAKKISVRLLALDQQQLVIRERKIDDINPLENKIIRYKGRLYSRSESDDTFNISIFNNGRWDTVEEEELPDM